MADIKAEQMQVDESAAAAAAATTTTNASGDGAVTSPAAPATTQPTENGTAEVAATTTTTTTAATTDEQQKSADDANNLPPQEAMVLAMDEKNEESETNVGHLEDEALKRKERLKTLREKKTFNQNKKSDAENNEELSFPKPIFRNYTPSDDVLKPGVLPKPKLVNIEEEIKEQLENAKPEPLVEKEIDLATLAPQKIDWDLKREAEKKFKILEKRTQAAIAELIRERLQKSKNPDFAELVSVGTKNNQTAAQDEDDD